MSEHIDDAPDEAKIAEQPVPASESEEESEELHQLFKQLAELRAKGIVSGGDGPRESLKPTAHVPGALARFLADGR